MRRSLLKLVVTSVLVFWGFTALVLYAYSSSATWNKAEAQRAGVYWVYRALNEQGPGERAELLSGMKAHVAVPIELVSVHEVEQRTGRALAGGDELFLRPGTIEAWLYLVFQDQKNALAVGPVNPSNPLRQLPVGLLLLLPFCPLLASVVTVRIANQLAKVERASDALGAGRLSARVDNKAGPAHELAARFNRMAERIERLVAERDELVQAVSHELGSPLARLRFQLELLSTDEGDSRTARQAAMTRELDELDDLVAELLSWVQADKAGLSPRRFDVTEPLRNLVELAQDYQAGDGEEVRIRAELPDKLELHADQRLFQRAVENLLRNAVKYASSTVSLSLRDGPEALAVVVADDGPGIPEPLREKVLRPFTRLEADRARDTGGAGLGLAIVHRIVSSHGGTIAVEESELGGAGIITTWPKGQ